MNPTPHLTTACTRPRRARPSSVSLNVCLVVCAAGDAGRYAAFEIREVVKGQVMKFFIPGAEEEAYAEEIYEAIKKFAKMTLGWDVTERRIFSIRYRHHSSEYYDEVGKKSKMNGEEVTAILESNAFLICTPTRGELRDMPILVGKSSVISVVDFED